MISHIVSAAAGGMLFAANWTDVIVPVVVFLVWLINQIAGAKKAKPPQPAARPQPARPGGANAPGQPAAAGQRGIMDEVEQFLRDARKAMEQQQKPAPKPAQPQAARPQQPRPQPVAQQQRPQQKPKQPRKQAQPGARTPQRLQQQAADRPLDDIELGGSVARHVEQHLDTTSRFEERAGRLSHLHQTVEQDIGAHVRHKFDHQVGTLVEQSGTRKDAAGAAMTTDDSATGPNSVVQIVAMLRDPQSMRNAIILQEILSPPTQRW